MKGIILQNSQICEFKPVTRKDLLERGYVYMEKVSGVFYKEDEIDFEYAKEENISCVKLTFEDGSSICINGADIGYMYPTYKKTFVVKLEGTKQYDNVVKIEFE